MSLPDLYEGDDDVRRDVCDWTGHDWIAGPADRLDASEHDVKVCAQCGAAQTVSRAESGPEVER